MAPIKSQGLLQAPSNEEVPTLNRTPSAYHPINTYNLPKGERKHYQQQYADMYFARLAQLKPAVERVASEAWADFSIGKDKVQRVDRVLDVRQGDLCWVVGTAFMEMPLKPNILDDISKDHWIAAPPPREKFTSPGDVDQVMLEDESGRLRLTGEYLKDCLLVTGCIVAVMGTENANGEFEIIDMKVPDLPRQPERWERDEADNAVNGKAVKQKREKSGKVALLSGLGFNGDSTDLMTLDLLVEFLLGESTSPSEQEQAARISRVVIAGNGLSHGNPIPARDEATARHNQNSGIRKYGYDSGAYNSAPSDRLDAFFAALLPSLPITFVPGDSDPTHVALPQQPVHPALFPSSRTYMSDPDDLTPGWFHSTTNPAQIDIDGNRYQITGGQPVDDIYKYVEGEARLDMMEAMMRWRLMAPTAPDTLWCYPFQDADQFVMKECPHVFVVGNQPRFGTRVIEGHLGQKCRLIMLPKFRDSGKLVLLDSETLEVEVVKFAVQGEEAAKRQKRRSREKMATVPDKGSDKIGADGGSKDKVSGEESSVKAPDGAHAGAVGQEGV
ncbi:hypothetical protein MBLNU457_3692t1 [Dothideomycetes sp. NU457]